MSWNHPQHRRASQRNWCLFMLSGMLGQLRYIQMMFPRAPFAKLELELIKAQEALKIAYDREPRQ